MVIFPPLFIAAVAVSIPAITLSLCCLFFAYDDQSKSLLKLRSLALTVLAIGFMLHAAADSFAIAYELYIEVAAHLLVLVSFVLFLIFVIKNTKEFWFE